MCPRPACSVLLTLNMTYGKDGRELGNVKGLNGTTACQPARLLLRPLNRF